MLTTCYTAQSTNTYREPRVRLFPQAHEGKDEAILFSFFSLSPCSQCTVRANLVDSGNHPIAREIKSHAQVYGQTRFRLLVPFSSPGGHVAERRGDVRRQDEHGIDPEQ